MKKKKKSKFSKPIIFVLYSFLEPMCGDNSEVYHATKTLLETLDSFGFLSEKAKR